MSKPGLMGFYPGFSGHLAMGGWDDLIDMGILGERRGLISTTPSRILISVISRNYAPIHPRFVLGGSDLARGPCIVRRPLLTSTLS